MLQEEAAIQAGWCAHLHAKYFSTVTGSLAPLRLSDGLAHSLWAISLVRSRTFSGEGVASLTPTASLTYVLPQCLAHACTVYKLGLLCGWAPADGIHHSWPLKPDSAVTAVCRHCCCRGREWGDADTHGAIL